MKFDTRTIGEVTERLIDYRGKTPPKVNSGVKLITAKIIKDGFIQNSNFEYISEETYETWMRRGLPKKGDILITTEAPLGEVAQVRTPEKIALAQRIILLRGNPQVIDQQYYFQVLKSPFVQAGLQMRGTGTTVLGIRQNELRQVEIPYYSLPTQHKIAAFLSNYDDLIENNTRRIKILEEMAGTIYREWFVEFRFPGHENVKMVESELGLIPQGWEVKPVKQLVKRLKAGQVYTQTDVKDTGKVIVVDQSRADVLGFHDNEPDHHATPKNPIVTFGDHTCKMQLMITPFSLGPNVVPFIARDEMLINYLFFQVSNLVKTTEYKRHWTDLNSKEVVVADSQTRKQFSDVLIPTFQQIEVLKQKNHNLRQTRDLLLPKLIPGELDVSDLNIKTDTIQ